MKSNEWNVGYGNQIVNKEGNMRTQSIINCGESTIWINELSHAVLNLRSAETI